MLNSVVELNSILYSSELRNHISDVLEILKMAIFRTIFRGRDFILIYADRYHIKQSLTNFHQRKIQKNDE